MPWKPVSPIYLPLTTHGGPGSGNWGHGGRPGEVGGSSSGGGGSTGLGQEKNDEIVGLASEAEGSQADATVRLLEQNGVRPVKYQGRARVVYRGGGARGRHVFVTPDKEYASEFGEVTQYTIVGGTRVYPDPQMVKGPTSTDLPHSFIVEESELIGR